MTDQQIAEAIHKKLKAIAQELTAAGKAQVATTDIVNAMQDPWICILYTPNGPWRYFNPVTQEWGGTC